MIKVRKARKDDIEHIIPLWLKLMRMHEPMTDLIKLSDDAESHFKSDMLKWLASDTTFVFVAEAKNAIIGYTVGWISNMPSVFKIKARLYINDMWVEKEYRQSGVGKMLMTEIKQYCKDKKLDTIDLSVAVANEASVTFWKKQGFKPVYYRMVQHLSENENS